MMHFDPSKMTKSKRLDDLEKRVAELERHIRGQAIELEPQFVDPLVEDDVQTKGVIR